MKRATGKSITNGYICLEKPLSFSSCVLFFPSSSTIQSRLPAGLANLIL
jgi:hypothetical protein